MDQVALQLFTSLADVAARQSAAAIAAKISAIRAKKQDAEAIRELTELVNDLVADRDEILAIAQGLKEQLVSQQISDDDIEHVVNTTLPVLRAMTSANSESGSDAENMVDQLKPILSQDTLKVLQTLGFNFRSAIGEPLTILLRNLILAQARSTVDNHELEVAQIEQQTELMRLAQDPDSHARLMNTLEKFRG